MNHEKDSLNNFTESLIKFFTLQNMTKLMFYLCFVVTGEIGGAPWGSKSRCRCHFGI
jgi:hypothetical protein